MDDQGDKLVWTLDTLSLLGRFGGKLALFAMVAWLFLRSIESTEQFAPLALLAALAMLGWAFFRIRGALIVSARGVPAEGTVSGFNEYAGASHSRGSFKMRQMEFSYEFDGQQFRGKSTWHGKRTFSEIALYQKIPLFVDPANPERAYWAPDLPGHSERPASGDGGSN